MTANANPSRRRNNSAMEVGQLVDQADGSGTAVNSQAEVAAALAKAARLGVLTRSDAGLALEVFRSQ